MKVTQTLQAQEDAKMCQQDIAAVKENLNKMLATQTDLINELKLETHQELVHKQKQITFLQHKAEDFTARLRLLEEERVALNARLKLKFELVDEINSQVENQQRLKASSEHVEALFAKVTKNLKKSKDRQLAIHN